jgi:hypothetical protein
VLGNTPITFPIGWHAENIEISKYHGFSAYFVTSSVAARFFPPQVAGVGATVGATGLPFRIDHDEKFNQTSHIQYEIPGAKFRSGIWGGFNWRFDSGLTAGAVPCYNPFTNKPNSACGTPDRHTSTILNGQPAVDLTSLDADEHFQAGLTCNGYTPSPTGTPIGICPASEYTSKLVDISALNKGDADHDPPRIQHRSLFDVTIGKDNIFHAEHYKVNLNLTAINFANNCAMYNFPSTFSGTHYVTPRVLTAKITLTSQWRTKLRTEINPCSQLLTEDFFLRKFCPDSRENIASQGTAEPRQPDNPRNV